MADPKPKSQEPDFFIERILANKKIPKEKIKPLVLKIKTDFAVVMTSMERQNFKPSDLQQRKIYELIIKFYIANFKPDSTELPRISFVENLGDEIAMQLKEKKKVFAKDATTILTEKTRRDSENISQQRKEYLESKMIFKTKSKKFGIVPLDTKEDLTRFGAELRLCFQYDRDIDGENWLKLNLDLIESGKIKMYLLVNTGKEKYPCFAVTHYDLKTRTIVQIKKAGDVAFSKDDENYSEISECINGLKEKLAAEYSLTPNQIRSFDF